MTSVPPQTTASPDSPRVDGLSSLEQAYSPEVFETLSREWQRQLSEHLRRVTARTGPVLNWREPVGNLQQAEAWLTGSAASAAGLHERFAGLLRTILASGQNLHHPRYIGHQVPASAPVAGLFDAISSITNQVMAIYEMGPWATAVEMAVLRALSRKVGWDPEACSGLLTHGGSLANLTALLTARNVRLPGSREHGIPAGAALVTHPDAHYCVTRSAGILGLGARNVVRVRIDARRRMDPEDLDRVLTRLRNEGRPVVAVSACACATPTGAFDPLMDIADVCRRHDVWLHVDAAHGGGLLISRRHRHKLAGLNQADSLVWDAHKMLFVPALCAAVLYREKSHRFQTFQQDAPYLFDPSSPGMADIDSGLRTIECTKRATGFGLWGLWSLFGESVFEEFVDRTLQRAAEFFELLSDAVDFEPLHEPECNIVAFRYVPTSLGEAPPEDLDRLQRELRTALIRSGDYYIVQTTLDGRAALRVTVMNPLTTRDDLAGLLDAIRAAGRNRGA